MFKRTPGKKTKLLVLNFPLSIQCRVVFGLLALLLILSVPALGQELHKWKDENGQWHISDKPPPNSPTQPDPVPSLKDRGPSGLGRQDERLTPPTKFSQAEGGLVYDRVTCRNRLPTMSEAEAMVVNNSGKTVQFKAHAEFFSTGGVLVERVEGIYDYKLAPGDKELVRVTLLRKSSLPVVEDCSLTLRSPTGSLRLR